MTLLGSSRAWVMALALSVLAACGAATPDGSWLGTPDRISEGVELYRSNDGSLVEDRGPIAVYLLKLDPSSVRIASVLSNGRVLDAEAVTVMAQRHRALAAVNGGFFNRTNGEPIGLLKVAGELVSDSKALKGVVIISSPPGGPTSLSFDRLAARMKLAYKAEDGQRTVPIDGVDTTRERGKLMLYTPAYHPHSDTAPTGTEWTLEGKPLRVTAVRARRGRTPIPRDGAVLSYGGVTPPPPLAALTVGTEVDLSTEWRSDFGVPEVDLEASDHIINGAGLLRQGGKQVTDWTNEGLSGPDFTDARHPRTMIGQDGNGAMWLAAVDGRQPDYSIGMTFADMQRLATKLGLTDALNLDGGGSTTMVVRDIVVNRPSDPAGARPVADAIIVTPR